MPHHSASRLLIGALSLILLAACGAGSSTTPDTQNGKNLASEQMAIRSGKSETVTYQDLVQDLYVAYFGRPADPNGLSNIESALLAAGAPTDIQGLAQTYASNNNVKNLIDSFGTSKESLALYGNGSSSDFVTAVFHNVLGRAPQASGLAYWTDAINSGSLSLGNAALSIMAGAEANTTSQGLLDAQLIANRIAVANSFTALVSSRNAVSSYSGSIAAASARALLAEVTAATSSADFDTTVNATVTALVNSTSGYAAAPTPMSASAATWTAQNNSLCTGLTSYYWEIGDANGRAISASQNSGSTPITGSTAMSIASASKWVYSTSVVQTRGSAANLSSGDIDFLHFTSGYTNMGNYTRGVQSCPQTGTVNQCLAQNALYSSQNPQTTGVFDYDSGHMEVHASRNGLGNDGVRLLQAAVQQQIGSDINIIYTQPLLAGGVYTTGNDYALMLRKILGKHLFMHDALGTSPVCTSMRAPCNSANSPVPEAWHYSIGHWVEDDPSTYGDGAYSSAGAFGFYPWIDATRTYYGILGREDTSAANEQKGYVSALCGRLLRHAWMTGVNQSDTLPDLPANQ